MKPYLRQVKLLIAFHTRRMYQLWLGQIYGKSTNRGFVDIGKRRSIIKDT